VFVKAILCNWMVCFGVVMAMSSTSTIGRIAGAWMPILIFFAQGFEHSVVNMFIIPTGMMMGAKVSLSDWWVWNQIPVTLGNLVGGGLFTGIALYITYARKKGDQSVPATAATQGMRS
jgi:formate transporter